MNFKTTGVLLALVIIGAVMYFTVGNKPESTATDEPSPAASKPTVIQPTLVSTDVRRFTITRPNEPPTVFERLAEKDKDNPNPQWRMVAPVESEVTHWMVNSIVNALANLQSNTRFEPGAKDKPTLTQMGLEPPRVTYTLATGDGKTYAIKIGGGVAVSNDTYVQAVIDGKAGDVCTVSRNFDNDVKRHSKEFRAKGLFKIARNDAVGVEVDTRDASYRLSRTAGGPWQFESPIRAFAQDDKVTAIIGGLGAMQVADFIDDAPASLDSFGLNPPYLTVVVTTEKTEPAETPAADENAAEPTSAPASEPTKIVEHYRLLIGGFADLEKKNRYIKRDDQPWVASATVESIEKLTPKLSELRDNHVTRMKASEAYKIDLVFDGNTYTFTKTDTGWNGEGKLAVADPQAITALLNAFEQLKAIDFIDDPQSLAEYGLEEPRAVIRVQSKNLDHQATLFIGGNTPSALNTNVMIDGQPTVMVVNAKMANRIAINPITLRSRDIIDAARGNITRIDSIVDGRRRSLEVAEGRWHFTDPADASIDGDAVRDLTNDLRNLRARTVVGEGDFSKYGLDRPSIELNFTLATPTEPPTTEEVEGPPQAPAMATVDHTLRVAVRDGLMYCSLDDSPIVFELDGTMQPVLSAELIRRQVLDLDAAKVDTISIHYGDSDRIFTRTEAGWTYEPDPSVPIDAKRVDDMLTSIIELRAEHYEAFAGGNAISKPTHTIGLHTTDGDDITLTFGPRDENTSLREGAWNEKGRTFVIDTDDVDAFNFSLEHYVASEEEAPSAK